MYEVCEEKHVDEVNGTYLSYGVKCSHIGLIISDVTCNKEKLTSFVKMLNAEKLEPVHLYDVIEDNINELI